MHEMSIARALFDLIDEQAGLQRFERVRRVHLEIGSIGHVDPGAVAFCFDAVARGTVAEGAVLEIDEVPGAAHCVDCAQTVTIAQRGVPCPVCGGAQLLVIGGDELRLKALEVT